MNSHLIKSLEEAARFSIGRISIISTNNQTTILGADVGESVDLIVAGKPVKLILVALPPNADADMTFAKVAPLNPVLAQAAASGIEAKALAWSQVLARGTADQLAKAAISSFDVATGGMRLLFDAYGYDAPGIHKTFPETGAIQSLATKRGKDLVAALISKPVGHRWTTQSLAKAVEEKCGKTVSGSVVHRFIRKLHTFELVTSAGATGFLLTVHGRDQIVEAFDVFKGVETGATVVDVNQPAKPSADPSTSFRPRNDDDLPDPPDDNDLF